jgi:DNA-directed RNA polymerase specialized sigma24 family protein
MLFKFARFQILETDAPLINHLTAEHRALIERKSDYKGVAAELGLPVGTVKSRIHRARASLVKLREQAAA